MLSSAIPTLVPLPFANSGTKNAIPTASQIGITPGAASLTDGFPPLTFTPIAAGGIPPAGADFNGILNLLSANTQWENAGGFYPYNSTFSTSIGGYPKGALLAMASGTGFWLSVAENNTVNPESGPSANWISMGPGTTQSGAYNYAADTGAANAYAINLSPVPSALVTGMGVCFIAGNANTGASTLTVNGTSKSLTKNGSIALAAGDIPAGSVIAAQYDGTRWQIRNPAYGSGSLLNVQTFTSTGTYTPTSGTASVIVEVIGGGGAGGGTVASSAGQSNAGGGGGSGAYGKGRYTSAFSGVTVTVGAGGTAVSGANGGNGGTSSFGALLSCPGGSGGSVGVSTGTFPAVYMGGVGATVSTGGNIENNAGYPGNNSYCVSASSVIGGNGGGTCKGGGAYYNITSNSAGSTSSSRGSGGSGANTIASGAAQAGGNGTGGIVIIHEYS